MNGVAESPSALALLQKGRPFIRPFRAKLALSFALSLGLTGLNVAEPLVLKSLFDGLGGPGTPAIVVRSLAALLVLMLVREAFSGLLDTVIWKVRVGVNFGLTQAMVERLHSLPLSFHRDQSVGALMTKMDRGITGAVTAFAELAFNVFPSLMYLAIALSVMLRLDWRITALTLAFVPIAPLLGAWASKEQTERERDLMDRWTSLYSRFNEVLSGILVVKSFAMEEVEKRRFLSGVQKANQIVVRGVRTDASISAAKNASTSLARIAALGFGGYLVLRGHLTVGTLVAFLGYIGGLFGPVQGLTGTYQTLRRGTVALETVFSVLDVHDRLGDLPEAKELARLQGEVEFQGVCFSYQPGKPILKNIDLRVSPGQTIALVGPSGGGKSTLLALLQRLYDPDAGTVLLDGQDIRKFKQRSVRQQLGVVLQDNLLFSDSVRDNIAFGCPGASFEQIVEAAKAANAHDFILELAEGYDSMVGDRGCKLSTGQRQRIAIARALLRNPTLLILDEPTSALDVDSERLVQEALSKLKKGRTTFIIAHRLSTITEADQIVVLKGGRIVEQGTHAELLASGGFYASMVQKQSLKTTRKDPRITSSFPAPSALELPLAG